MQLVHGEARVFLRQHAPVRGLEDRQELHVLEHLEVARRQVIADGLLKIIDGDRRVRAALLGGIVVGQKDDGFHVGVRITDDRLRDRQAIARELELGLELVLLGLRRQHRLDVLGRLRIEERDLAVEPAGALDVDVELVRPVGHEDEEHPPAIGGVAHELLDASDHA